MSSFFQANSSFTVLYARQYLLIFVMFIRHYVFPYFLAPVLFLCYIITINSKEAFMTKYSFSPLIDHSSKILVLGSLPGEESLKQAQYYAHPRNAFWKIMFIVFNEAYSEDYSAKCELLLKII